MTSNIVEMQIIIKLIFFEYYKFEVIENYKLEGEIIPIRELKGMI